MQKIEGSCHCGKVQYRCSEPFQFNFLCYCDNCKKINGGLRLAGAMLPKASLTTKAETKVYVYQGGKGEIELHFCPECGTPVCGYPKSHPDAVVIRANTLSDYKHFDGPRRIFDDQACGFDFQH